MHIALIVIQLIFLQQYFSISVPYNITRYGMGMSVIAQALGLCEISAIMVCFN